MLSLRTLGRTNLKVTLLGLGSGGNSRLGLSTGADEAHAADVVRAALDEGINLFDTARVYGTERALGQALQGRRRDQVVVSSKTPYRDSGGELLAPQALAENIDTSLRELGLETIDIYFIHALRLADYDRAVEQFVPVLEKARQAGKIRFMGVTEGFESDTHHDMLHRAASDPTWDVLMVGFNLLNSSARERVLPQTQETGAGTLCMFAVRKALAGEKWLRTLLGRLADEGTLDPSLAQSPDLMDALGLRGAAQSFSEAAYRFAAFEPGMDAVLVGTGSPDHLRDDIAAVQHGPLPAAAQARLKELFGKVVSTSGQVR